MKKFINTILAALTTVAVLLTAACTGGSDTTTEEPKPADISLLFSSPEVVMSAEGGVVDVKVVTNAESWDFVAAISWAEVERTDNGLSIYATENKSNSSRNGDILVIATTGTTVKERTITVEQVASGGTTADGSLTFECPVFEELVLSSFDTDGDGAISATEAARVTDLDLTLDENSDTEQEAITSLKGIKNFVNLVNLDCPGNLITSLDLSGMEKLEYVDCCYNKIKSLNVTGCKSLKWLYCYVNDIESVLHEGCDNLMFFQAYKNKLTSIDMSGKPELIYFDVMLNSLHEAKFDNCPKLKVVALGNNNLISISLEGLPELYTLGCYQNNIASLDLSKLPNLEMLECYTNNLASLDLSANTLLSALTCQNNLITELKIDNCTALRKLECNNNRLTGTLDLNKHKSLTILSCGGNNLTAINVNECTALTNIDCANTMITALDTTSLSLLESLIANNCLIATMDCSNNRKLKTLYLQGNPLTSLVLATGQTIEDMKIDNYDVISYK